MKRKQSLLLLSNLVFLILLFCSGVAHAIYPFPIFSTQAETAAYIVWRTDIAGTSQVNYGPTPAHGSSTTPDSSLVTYHAQTIIGLSPGTTYHYQVVSTDGSGNTVHSTDRTFTTLAAPTGTVKEVIAGGGGDFTTISACASAAQPGWTCEVHAGSYDEKVNVSQSGSSGSPIIFEAYDAVKVAAFYFSSSVSYVTIEGFEISTSAFSDFQSCSSMAHEFTTNSNSYLTIADNYVHNVYYGDFMREGTSPNKSNYLQVLNNVMAFAVITNTNPPYNYPCATSSAGMPGLQEYGDHSLYDGNYFSEADHISYNAGAYDIYRRNVMSDTYAADWGADPTADHVDFFHPAQQTAYGGSHMIHNVLEGNQEYNANASDEHFYLASGCGDQSAQSLTPATGDGVTKTFTGTLSLTNPDGTDTGIAPFSITVAVNAKNLGCSGSQYSKVTVSAVDDGFGNLVNYPGGSGISSGTINYSTGAISVTFSSAPASGTPVTAYYDLLTLGSHDMIVRYNLAYNVGSCFAGPSYGGTPGMRIYNNTLNHVGYNSGSSNAGGGDSYTGLSDANPHWVDLNNLFYDAWMFTYNPPWGYISALSPPARTPGYGLVFTPSCDPSPGCSYTSSTTSAPGMVVSKDPLLKSPSTYDFTLQIGSPSIKKGTYLTTVASTDSGSGRSLIVNDAGFFQDGYGISGVDADCISVTTVTNHVCIQSIDYQTNTLTLASGITRSAGDKVWLYSDSTGRQVLVGGAPHIGATFLTPPTGPPGVSATPH